MTRRGETRPGEPEKKTTMLKAAKSEIRNSKFEEFGPTAAGRECVEVADSKSAFEFQNSDFEFRGAGRAAP
jgi:hypothetical protein